MRSERILDMGVWCPPTSASLINKRIITVLNNFQNLSRNTHKRVGMPAMRWIGTALLSVALLAAGPVWADPPAGKGGGKGQGQSQGQGQGRGGEGKEHGNSQGNGPAGFAPNDRTVIQNYFAAPTSGPNCPPGLAKKNNGCMPPGQAKQYTIGRALPAGVVMYPLPGNLVGRLAPPPGYQYMRVGSDILMLAIGTNMVVSALENMVR